MLQVVLAVIALLSAPPAAVPAPKASAPAVPAVSKWTLDPENSSVGFVCKHVFTNVKGLFPQPSGAVTIDETTPANSKVSATIDPSLITTGVEERDTHLKSADFFDVAKYPTVTFVSTKVEPGPGQSGKVYGDLTLHGVTKPVVLDVTFNGVGSGFVPLSVKTGFSAVTTIKRSDFGVSKYVPLVGDDVQLNIEVEFDKK